MHASHRVYAIHTHTDRHDRHIHTRTDAYMHTLMHQEVISAHTHTHTASPSRRLRPTYPPPHTLNTHTNTHQNQSQCDRRNISKNTQHHTQSIRTQRKHNQKTNTDAPTHPHTRTLSHSHTHLLAHQQRHRKFFATEHCSHGQSKRPCE